MKKVTVLAVFAAACISASAFEHHAASSVRDTREGFTMRTAGAEHSMLRPANVKLPKGYTSHAQRHIKNFGHEPDARLKASNWSVLEHETGAYWFFTQEYSVVNDWYYGASDFTIYDAKMKEQATIHFDAPEGETCNSIMPFGMVTNKFFDIDDKTWEIMVYVHCITPDYTGKNYIYIVNNKGEVLHKFDGYSAQFIEFGSGYNAQRRLLIGQDNLLTGKYSVDVYKKASWGGEMTKEHTFELDSELTNYSDGPAVNAYTIDDQPYYTTSHYEKPYINGFDSTGSPIVTPNNNYVVEVYNGKYEKIATVKDPVEELDKGYCMRTFGYFSYNDLTRSFNNDGSNRLDLIITKENYLFDTSDDTYLFGWNIYNEDNEKINEMGGRTVDWWELNPIKGQPDQVAMYTIDEGGSGHIEVYDLPSCELAAGFDDTVAGMPISTSFDRVPVEGGYDYITGISQGYLDDKGNILGVVAWLTPDGELDKRVNFNLGPHAQYFTMALSSMTLNPYVFNTDDKMEYLYQVKVSRNDGTEALDDIIVIADSEGNEIRRFSSDNTYNQLSACDVLYDADHNPFFLIAYYASDYANPRYGESDVNIYELPLNKWPNGGSGTAADPYHIASAGDLMHVNDNPNAFYVVDNDIDFSYFAQGWEPLGIFSGHFDGQNHKFSNLYIAPENKSYYSGLFSMLSGAKISNIIFDKPEIHLNSAVNYGSVLAGDVSADTDINHIAVISPTVSGENYNGSYGTISAHASGTVASECYVSGANINLPQASEVGGIFGFATASGIAKASAVSGNINAKTSVGGIIGGSYINGYAENCHADVNITGHHYVGGIMGASEKRGPMAKNYAEGKLRTTGGDYDGRAGAGGIVGYVEPKWTGDDNAIFVTNCLSAVEVEGAGTNPSIHRIVGSSANDYPWTEEEIRKGKSFRESGMINNYSTISPVAGMEIGANETDGETVKELTLDFLIDKLGISMGETVDSPWVFSHGKLHLYIEDYFAGCLGEIITDINDTMISDSSVSGIFDLQGRRYNSITAPGIYVVNGKKIVVK